MTPHLLVGATGARAQPAGGHYPVTILALPESGNAYVRYPSGHTGSLPLDQIRFPTPPRTITAWLTFVQAQDHADYAEKVLALAEVHAAPTTPDLTDLARLLVAHARQSPAHAVAVRDALLHRLVGRSTYERVWLDAILDIAPEVSLPPLTCFAPPALLAPGFTWEFTRSTAPGEPLTWTAPHDGTIQRIFVAGCPLHPGFRRTRGSHTCGFALTDTDIPVWKGDDLTFRYADRYGNVGRTAHFLITGITHPP